MQKRKFASNIILFLFLILVATASIFSDIFQSPIKSSSEIIEQAKLFSINDLFTIVRIKLKNKSGEYEFEKIQPTETSQWHMVSPRNISANSLFIEKLLKSLTTIKVKKIFPDEKVNISNLSIDKPTSTLNLIDQSGKITTIVLGLMNTIDNSTYLKITGRNGIFHVEAPNISLENASIIDLIESQIISINLDTIASLKIFHGNKKTGLPQLEIKKTDINWHDQEGNILSQEKVEEYLQELSSLKSSFIIDKQTDSQKRQIANLVKNAQYIVSIEDNKTNITDYNISGIIKDFSDIDLKNEDYFNVSVSNASTTYIVNKEFFELFKHKSNLLFDSAVVGKSLEKNQ